LSDGEEKDGTHEVGEKIMCYIIETDKAEGKVKVLVPMYEPLEVTKRKKCGKGYNRSKGL
jgi:hypothetical protein